MYEAYEFLWRVLRLVEECDCSCSQPLPFFFRHLSACEDHDRDCAFDGRFLESLEHGHPVQLRHHEIEHDQVGQLLRDGRECLLAVGGLDEVEATGRVSQRFDYEPANGLLVVDDEDGAALAVEQSGCHLVQSGLTRSSSLGVARSSSSA
jgi:hypothetical protein